MQKNEDIYETDDLPECDLQSQLKNVINDDNVSKIDLAVGDIYQKFKNKHLLTDGADFSDSVDKRRKGYLGQSSYVELVRPAVGDAETIVEQYMRLQNEIRELTGRVEETKIKRQPSKSDHHEETLTTPDSKNLVNEIAELQQNLKQLQLEQVLGAELNQGFVYDQVGVIKKIFDSLDNAKNQTTEKGTKSKADDSSSVTYELFCLPSETQKSENVSNLNKMASLESRLATLEKILGTDNEHALISGELKAKSLADAISTMEQRLSLLDINQLDLIDARLSIILHKYGQVKEKKSTIDAGQNEKINELYELMRKWDGLCSGLPQIVSRLQSLKDLHEQALQFSQSITYIDGIQQGLNKTMDLNVNVLKEFKETFAKNLDIFKTNCETIQKRMDALSKK